MGRGDRVPGPRQWLAFHKRYKTHPIQSFEADWRAHGDVFRITALPGMSFWFAADPDSVEHVLRIHQSRYQKARPVTAALRLALGNGIVTSERDAWRRQRRMMQPAFHREALDVFAPTMARRAAGLADDWAAKGDGAVVEATDEMQRLTLGILAEALFGQLLGDRAGRFTEVFRRVGAFIDKRVTTPLNLPLWVPTGRHRQYRRDKRVLDEIALALIRERRADLEPPARAALLSSMIRARDGETGPGFTDEELVDQVITLLVAGHETVSVTLSWALHLLTTHPDEMAALHESLSFLGDRPPAPEDLPRLARATQAIEETLRIYPPVWALPRETLEPDTLGGHEVPKGAIVFLPAWFTHRNPDLWPDPARFDPSRFEPDAVAARPRFAWYPFGGGPRVCIGNSFALMEATLILATLVQRFDIEAASEAPVEIDPTFTVRPKGGLPLRIRARRRG